MAAYVILSRLSHDAFRNPTDFKKHADEVSGKIKKIFRDKEGIISESDREALEGELGDVLWYLAQISTELGLSLDEIAEHNIAKLLDRQARGKIHGDGDNR